MINLIKIEYRVTLHGMWHEPNDELLAEHHNELIGHILDTGYGWILVGYLPSPQVVSGVDIETLERILSEYVPVHVEVGTVKVSFWLEDPANPSDCGDIDYIMEWKESQYVYENRKRLIGDLDEKGSNHVILVYDSLEDLVANTTKDAATLKQIIEEYNG